jgi:hypothetical protein
MKDLFDFGTAETPTNAMEAAFWTFHSDNPEVYRLFDRFTRYAIQRGRKRFSAYVVFERIRWETSLETSEGDYKLNNNHRPYYARLWLRNNPAFSDFFSTRETTAGPVSDALKQRAA